MSIVFPSEINEIFILVLFTWMHLIRRLCQLRLSVECTSETSLGCFDSFSVKGWSYM